MRRKIRVLVVDDSVFFQKRIIRMLDDNPEIEVVGTAVDGQAAVQQTLLLQPDVVTMDVQMPVMDGIAAVKRIMAERPTPVIMFSSLTREGARATLDALDAGAADFLSKIPQDDGSGPTLVQRVQALGRKTASAPGPLVSIRSEGNGAGIARKGRYRLVAIGASTGGPAAIQKLLAALPAGFALPILLIVHMPASFTPAYAQRLNDCCRIPVKEAEDGDRLQPGRAYLAPGGRQLLLEKQGGGSLIRIMESPAGQTYRPSVDISLGSAARVFSSGVLAIILTGMGADGRQGAQMLKKNGSTVWSQDEASCVVYGMPQAVEKAGISDRVLALSDMGPMLQNAI